MIRICLCIVMLAGAFAFPSGICAGEEPKSDGRTASEELNWRLGAQAYTFRRMTFFEAVDILSDLGMKYVEMYPRQRVSKDIDARTQPGMSGEVMDKIKAKLKSSGVELVNYGVAPPCRETRKSAGTSSNGRKRWRSRPSRPSPTPRTCP